MKNCACSCFVGLLLLLGQNQVLAQISPPVISATTNQFNTAPQITLGWDPSPDPSATGYYVAWGSVTGQCTNLVDLGNVTNGFASGFSTNVIYYFTIIAYDAVGDQAPPSNQIQYMVTNMVVAAIPPSITADLTNQTLAAGASTTLYVAASGTSPLTFWWFFNGGTITTVTTNSLALNKVTSGQAGAYQVVISNSAGSVTSSIANIAVLYPPSITLDISNETVATGSTASFAVNVAGSSPIGFTWLFNGAVLQGANSNPLMLNSVSGQQVGTYQVVVSNAVGVVTGQVAILSVLDPPSINSNPTNETVVEGSNATFQVGVSGSSPFTYQWFFNGKQVLSAAGNTLALNNVSSGDAGAYQVVIGNSVGSTTSAVAFLSVLVPPSITQDLTNQSVAVGSTLSLQIQAAGSDPLGYQWLFGGRNLVLSNTNSLVLTNVDASYAGDYQVIVTNGVGSITSSVATVTVLWPPSIVLDLTNQTVFSGSMVGMAVQATGTAPLNYQWYFNTAQISGATDASLTLSNVGSGQTGAYQVTVSNAVGVVTSAVANLTVLAPPSVVTDISNQTVAAGSQVTLNLGVTGSAILMYQWFYNGTPLIGATTNPLVLPKISTSQSGTYQATVSNLLGKAQSSASTLTVLQNKMLHAHQYTSSLISLTFAAVPLQSYTVQSATNLSGPWITAGTTTTDAYGVLNYDIDPTTPVKYYRITSP